MYDSSAAFDLKSLNPILQRVNQGLQIGGTSRITELSESLTPLSQTAQDIGKKKKPGAAGLRAS
jgi:hypothetical protein